MSGSTDSRSHDSSTSEAGPGRWASRAAQGTGSESGATRTGAGEVWSRYHCPVCSHQDRVTLTGRTAHILCSHCETPLEVTLPTPLSESVIARVDLDLPRT